MRKFGIANGREGGGCGRLNPLLFAAPHSFRRLGFLC